MSLSARSSFSWKQKPEGGSQKSEAFFVSNLPSCRGLKRVGVWEQELGRDVLSLRGIQLKACKEGPVWPRVSRRWSRHRGGRPPRPQGSCWTRARPSEMVSCRSSRTSRSTWLILTLLSRSSRRKDLSIYWKALSSSMVKEHRPSLLCFWSHRLMGWTMASQPFVVSNPALGRATQSYHQKRQPARLSL